MFVVFVVENNKYKVFTNSEMLYLNTHKQVYRIKDESNQDGFLYCKDFGDGIGNLMRRLLYKE